MISPTAISTFLYCPRKLFIERVLKIFKIPKEAMIKGTLKHEIFEEINNQEKGIVLSIKRANSEYILTAYKRQYSIIARKKIIKYSKKLNEVGVDQLKFFTQFWKVLMSEAEDRSISVYNFIKEHNLFGEQLWAELTPKIISELRVSDTKLGIRGIIDELRDYGKMQIPVELKSGKSPKDGAWPGHKAQVAAYMLILKNKGHIITEGIIKYIDEKKEVIVPLNAFLEEELLKQIGQVNQIVESKALPKRIDSFNKCNTCQLKEECYNDSFMEEKVNAL